MIFQSALKKLRNTKDATEYINEILEERDINLNSSYLTGSPPIRTYSKQSGMICIFLHVSIQFSGIYPVRF